MDRVAIVQQMMIQIKKYRYVLVVLAVGLLLMMLPEKKDTPEKMDSVKITINQSVEEELADILSRIQGAGKVRVMLTECSGAETIYQTDEQMYGEESRSQTLIVSGPDRTETGLVRKINPPVYLGALVVCQGGDSPSVKLAIVEAVMSVTGLSSHQITVLKMK